MWKGALAVVVAVSAHAEPFLSGHVLDAGGKPVPAAVVGVVRLAPGWRGAAGGGPLPLDASLASATTGDDGVFRIDAAAIPAGFHALFIRPAGQPALLRWKERVAFGQGTLPSSLDLSLPASVRVRGIVLDETGAAVAGASLEGFSESARDAVVLGAKTDEKGAFDFAAPADAVLTLVAKTADRWGIVRAPLGADPEATLAVHVAPMQALDSVVTSQSTGRPVAGVHVTAHAPSWDPLAPTEGEATSPPWALAPSLGEQVTGDDGRVHVSVPAGGLAMTTSPTTMAMRVVAGTTALRSDRAVRGRVVDDRGAVVAGAIVGWNEIPITATTDDAGAFTLPPDVHAAVLVATADGGSRSLQVDALPPDLRVIVPAASRVAGAVVRGDANDPVGGAPVGGATVRIQGDAWDVLTATDAGGRFAVTMRGARAVTASKDSQVAKGLPGDAVFTLGALEARASSAATTALHVTVVGESGAPLRGALLHAVLPDDMEALKRPLPTSASDEEGSAVLQLSRDAPHVLIASRPGRAEVVLRDVRPGRPVRVTMPPGATIRGIVRDTAGHPVGGAQVIAEVADDPASAGFESRQSPQRKGALPTDASGAYSLRDLPAGPVVVDVVAARLVSPPSARVQLTAGKATTLDLVLSPGSTLRGVVHDERGPIAGAVVRASPRGNFLGDGFGVVKGTRAAYTSDDGTFAIEGLPSDDWYDVSAEAPWHARGSGGGRPSESNVDVTMASTGAIEVDVIGGGDAVSVGCDPKTEDERARPAWGEVEAGRATLDGVPPGTYSCHATAELAAGVADDVVVRAGAATPITIRLVEVPSLSVVVLDAATGAPIAGAHADGSTTDATGRARLPLPTAMSAEDMARALEGLDPENASEARDEMRRRERTIMVQADGHEPADASIPEPAPAEMTIRLKALPLLRGRVVDATGAPVAGADLSWYPSDVVGTSGPDGRFSIPAPVDDGDEVAPSTLTAHRVTDGALEEGSAETRGLPPGQEVTIRVAEKMPASLVVVVRDADGPVAGARVAVMSEEGEGGGTTDAEGRVSARNLAPGDVQVMVELPSGDMVMKRGIELPPGEHVEIIISLDQYWWVTGRVLRAGAAAEGVELLWVSPRDGSFGKSARTRADGSFRLGPIALELDAVQVALTGPVFSPGRRPTPVKRTDPPLVLDVGGLRLVGRVIAGDAPVASAYVRLECASTRAVQRTSDDGRFTFEDAPLEQDCRLHVDARDMPETVRAVHVASGTEQDVGDIAMERLTLRVRVDGPEGAQPTDVGFELGERSADATPTPDGAYEIVAGRGRQILRVSPGDGSGLGWQAVAVDAPASLVVKLEAAARLEVALRDADGKPGEDVVALQSWNGIEVRESAMAEDGTATFGDLPPGHVTLSVGDKRTLEADLTAGQTTRVSATVP